MTGHPADVDWAHTGTAEHNRRIKAQTLAAWCWQRAITATDLDHATSPQLATIAGQAHVNPPGPGSTTWHHTKILLERMAVWAAQHPDDTRAAQPYSGLRHAWITTAREVTHG